MGEEEKKQPEENKEEPTKKPVQEKKVDEVPEEKKKKVPESESTEAKNPEQGESKENTNKEPPPPPPPPQEIILRVYMHCEGCARKVRRCLKGFDGVEKVETDCKASKVVVKGEKADPLKVLERVQRKSRRQVELLSPIPKPPAVEEPKKPEPIQIEAKKEEEAQVVTVVLMVHMHCEACAQEIRRQIQKMKGVESAMPDLKSSEVVVKGRFKAPELINFIHKRTGKQAVIIKVETENNQVEENAKKDTNKEEKKEEKKDGEKDSKKSDEKDAEKEKTESAAGGGDKGAIAKPEGEEEEKNDDPNKQEMKKSELMYNYPQNYQLYNPNIFIHQEHGQHAYPPQIFSDENPNSCTVM